MKYFPIIWICLLSFFLLGCTKTDKEWDFTDLELTGAIVETWVELMPDMVIEEDMDEAIDS